MSNLKKRIIEEIPDKDETMSTSTLADAVLALVIAQMAVTDEDAIQIMRGYWRNFGARFGVAEIKNMVELLEVFVLSKLEPQPTDNGGSVT